MYSNSIRAPFVVLAILSFIVVAYASENLVSGVVLDSTGATVAGARVTLLSPPQVAIAAAITDPAGRFRFSEVASGSYVLMVTAGGFAGRRLPITVPSSTAVNLAVALQIRSMEERITVTAEPGSVEHPESVIQPVNVITEEGIRERATAVVAQVANEELGIHLQRTSPTIAGIYVRGLTGNKVNVFVDGVRFSTSAMRGGINTFLDLLDPSNLQAVEILRGPNSAQFGSDALGGSVQLLSRFPSLSASAGAELHGAWDTLFNSADAGFGSSLVSSYSTRHFAVTANFSGRRSSRLRTGGALDSHAAVSRFLGLDSDILSSGRLPDTAFTQYGGMMKVGWTLNPLSQIQAHYSRSQIDGGQRYDQLLGGDGNLVADLRNLMSDLAYLRYNRFKLGWFDDFTSTWSFNSQREERVNQGGNGNPRTSITHEYERTTAQGLQAHVRRQVGRHQIAAGGEFYHERIRSPSFSVNPLTNTAVLRRGRIPDRAQYNSGGLYVRNTYDALTGRLRLAGSLRYSAASYRARATDSPLVGGRPLWPDDSLRVSDFTYRAGVVFTAAPGLNLFGNISRGFRAPHMTDLGTFGLTGSGFEVAATDLAGLSATVGSSASSDAVSTGRHVEQVGPESSLSYEGGAHFRNARFNTDLSIFVNDINDNITKQALILPPGAVGITLAGQPIMAQAADGAVFVTAATNPVLARTNYDDARIRGIEHSFDWRICADVSLSTRATYLRAHDRRTGLPPNIEGGTPAPDGYLKIRYYLGKKSLWLEPFLHAATRQERLSSLDLEDRRTGAARSRSSIRSFFLNGASARGLVGPGPDGVIGSTDDRLLATNETLAQVQNRVLGAAAQSAPLYTAVPGYATINLRAGLRIGEKQDVLMEFSNIGDRNYRGISWGLDAPGRALAVRYRIAW